MDAIGQKRINLSQSEDCVWRIDQGWIGYPGNEDPLVTGVEIDSLTTCSIFLTKEDLKSMLEELIEKELELEEGE